MTAQHLSDAHRTSLEAESSIRSDLILERGYRTITAKTGLKDLISPQVNSWFLPC
jgi:hypothetical protein